MEKGLLVKDRMAKEVATLRANDKLSIADDVMSQPVATIDEESPLRDAARRMIERKIGCLVVTRDGRLAGILTESDFVRAAAEEDA